MMRNLNLEKQKQAEARAKLCSRVKVPAGYEVERVFYTQPSGVSRSMTLEQADKAGYLFVFDQMDPDQDPLEIAFLTPTGIQIEIK